MGPSGLCRMLWVSIATIGIATAGLAPAAGAGEVVTRLSGSFNNSQDNACIHVSKVFFLTDCMYAPVNAVIAGEPLPWTGPTVNPVYYGRGSAHAVPTYVPVAGDDRISPTMEATFTIDDRGTPDPADDLIGGTMTVGPAARSVVANVNELAGRTGGAPPRAVISWSSTVHTLEPTPVTTAVSDGEGGRIYVIGSKGFPERLCMKTDAEDCFPSAHAPEDDRTGRACTSGPVRQHRQYARRVEPTSGRKYHRGHERLHLGRTIAAASCAPAHNVV